MKMWSKSKWHRVINKEIHKKNKLRSKLENQEAVVSSLIEEYQKRYLY